MGSTKDNTITRQNLVPTIQNKQKRPQNVEINRFTQTIQKHIYKVRYGKTILFVLLVILYFAVFKLKLFVDPENSLVTDIRMAIFGTYLFIAYLGFLLMPVPKISRPHPYIWRLLQGLTLAYTITLCFLLFLSKENMQFVLHKIFDRELGTPLPERSYAEDCRIYTPENTTSNFANIAGSIDIFVFAHFFGWTVKTWIFRNSLMAWTCSLLFEVFEWTMEVWLKNFAECWWDHWILDVFGCNLIGMLIGVFTLKYFNMRPYHWFLEPNAKMASMTFWEKTKYLFTSRAEYVKNGKWHWLGDNWSFNSILWYIFGINSVIDLSYFYNKANLEIPPPHFLLKIRMFTVGLFAILASSEYYEYIIKRKANAMGFNIFLIHVIIILEGLLWLKHLDYSKIFAEDVHTHMKLIWVLILTFLTCCHLYIAIDKDCLQKRRQRLNSEAMIATPEKKEK